FSRKHKVFRASARKAAADPEPPRWVRRPAILPPAVSEGSLRRTEMQITSLKQSANGAAARPVPAVPIVAGRGLRHRKLSRQALIALAADIATGRCSFAPSIGQVSLIFGLPTAVVRKEIKARAATNGNGAAKPLTALADQLIEQLGLDEAFELLVQADK